MGRSLLFLVLRATLLTACAVVLGLVFNFARPNGIPVVAPAPYDIFVPCPEGQEEAETVAADELAATDQVYVDARPQAEYEQEHIKGAVSFPYPVLGDPDPAKIEELKTAGRPIVTYGGGGRDGLGDMLAALLAELGVEQVTSLEGGLEAWRQQGGATESARTAPEETKQ